MNAKTCLSLLLLCLVPLWSLAQPLRHVPLDSTLPFIRYDLNQLYIGSDSTVLNALFDKWQRVAETGEGSLSIVHIGASHVQAGTLPHEVRRNILRAFPDRVGDRGMVFPYSAAARCNNPGDYAVRSDRPLELCRCVYKEPTKQLGLCGISVTAQDSTARIDMALRNEGIDYQTNQVILFGYESDSLPHDTAVVPLLGYQGKEIAPSYVDPATRRYVFNLESATDSFRIVLPCGPGQMFTLTGVYLGHHGGGISYHSIGVNGAAVRSYLDKCPYLTRDLRLLRPDLVIFGIGINDASGPNFDSALFHAEYRRLADSIRSVSPSCAFLYVTNNDSYRRVGRSRVANTRALQVRAVMRRLAQETQGAMWDQFGVMGGLKSMTRWRNAKLGQRDRVHFTNAGYALIGDLLTNALFDAINHHSAQNTPQDAGSRYLSY